MAAWLWFAPLPYIAAWFVLTGQAVARAALAVGVVALLAGLAYHAASCWAVLPEYRREARRTRRLSAVLAGAFMLAAGSVVLAQR